MSTVAPHPYTITVHPLPNHEGKFGWALRKSGQLLERSDRIFSTEAKAFENAMRAVAYDIRPTSSGRP